METVDPDHSAYAPGSLVHISGTGYAPDCDIVVKVTRPDGLVVTGDGSGTLGSDTVTTDLFGNFTYDYQLQGMPAIEGQYFVDVLGEADVVLAQTDFFDAQVINTFSDAGLTTVAGLFQRGNTVFAQATGLNAGKGYEFQVLDPSGTVKQTGSCVLGGGSGTLTNSYALQAADPLSGSSGWTYRVLTWNGGLPCSGSPNATDSTPFYVAKVSTFSDSALTIPKSVFTAGQTVFLQVQGFQPSVTNGGQNGVTIKWLKPGETTASATCTKTSNTGGNLATSDANGLAPGAGGKYFRYSPNNTESDSWNKLSGYDSGVTCAAFAAGNQGQWKIALAAARSPTTPGVLNAFTVDTTPPSVTINQGSGQADPTTISPLHFTAVFSEAVSGFTGSDVSITGTAGGTKTAAVTEIAPNNGTTYDVAVSGMTTRGTVVATIPAGGAQDAAGNGSNASTSTDNTVTWDRVPSTGVTLNDHNPKTNDTLTATATPSDPDGDAVTLTYVWKVNGTTKQTTVTSSTTDTFDLSVSGQGDKGQTVTVEVTPSDGLFNGATASDSATVANTAPTVALSGANDLTVNEGSTVHTYSYTISDPDGDTIGSVNTSCGTNGTKVASSDSFTNTSGSFQCTFPDGPASSTVTALATDSGFGAAASNPATQTVTINNVAPSIAISGNADVNEGSAYSLTLGAVSDPGTDTVTSYVVHWGDGQSNTYSTNGAKSHTYADGPNDYNVTVDLIDEDATFTNRANAFSVHVNNVAPSITISGPASLNEGSPYSLILGAVSDPGQDTVSSYVVHWGDGQSDTYSSNGAKSHTYADGPNDYSITVDLVDEDGTFNDRANPLSVHVDNVAPTATLSNDGPVDEGSSATISVSGQSDPSSADTSAGFRYEYRCDGSAFPGPADYSSASTSASTSCAYTDNGSYTVRARIIDKDNGATAYATTVVVNNVAPSLTAAANQTTSEGSSHSFDIGSFSDPGADSPWEVTVDWGDGSFASQFNVNSTGTIPAQDHTYADGPNDYTVKVTVADKDGASDQKSFSVHVDNVEPTIAISGNASVDEGSPYSLTLGAVTDPGQDTVSGYVVHWGDGQSDTYASDGVKSHTYADGPNNYSVTVDLIDEDGNHLDRANALSVQVDNVAPSIAISGNASVDEGSPYSLSLGAVSDPGQDTVSSYVVHWGDGSSDTYGSNGSKSHTYADGPDDHAITVDLVDEDGTFTDAANPFSVHVNNVAPTANLSGPADVDEGSTHTYTFTVTDPGQDTFTVNEPAYPDCGSAGSYVSGSLATDASGGSFDCSFPDGPAQTDVKIRVTDSDGASDTDSESVQVVQVANVAPDVTAPADQTSDEGASHSFELGSFTDPGDDSPWHVTVDWNDGSFATSFDVASSGTIPAQSHTYADGPNDYTVTVTVDDGDDSTSKTFSVHVNNVAPTIAISGNANVNEGSSYSLTLGGVTDPGQDTVSSYVVHWGDGHTDAYGSNGVKSHTYADGPDDHAITVDLVDEDGTFTNAANALSVHVDNVAPTVTLSTSIDLSVNEGSTHTYSYTISDPGQDTVSSVDTSCGANATKSNASNDDTSGAFDCTFPDGPASSTVSVSATDSDGDAGNTDSQSVSVANVPPHVTLSASNDLSVNEGSTHTYSYTISDPGQDTVSSVDTSCGANGTKSNASNDDTGGSFDCTFPDGDAGSTVSVQATDSDNDPGNTDTQSVTIHNVAPTIAISGNANVDEGSSYSLALGAVTDPGQDTVSSYIVHWGDGQSDTYSTNGVKSHTYADGPNDYDITVDLIDEDGTFADAANALAVHVDNVAPTVSFTSAPASSDEGQGKTYSYAISDPGQDTVSAVDPSCGANGTISNASNTDTSGSFDCTFPDGPSSSTVSVSATDSDGDAGNTDSQAVSIANVAPSVSYTVSPVSANEGQTKTYAFSVFDPGADTYAAATGKPDCGSGGNLVGGSYSVSGSSGAQTGTFQCSFPDGPANPHVTLSFTDSDGDTGNTADQQVDVANVAPTANLSGPANVDEGTTHTYTFTVTDPGQDTFTVNEPAYPDCGTGGQYVSGSLTTDANGGSFDCSFPDGPAQTDVKIRVTDSDGASDTDSESVQVVQVANVPPAVTAPDNQSSDEGASHSFDLGSFTDPGDDSPWQVSVDWGDGSFATVFTVNTAGTIPAQSHTYADGPSDHTVTVTVDDGTDSTSKTFSVHVNNVAPSIAISGNANVDEGSPYSLTLGAVTDPGADTVSSYVVHWGDGQSDTYSTNGAKSHVYADGPDDHAITVDLVDEDGTFTDAANPFAVHVNNVAPSIAISGNASVDEGSGYSLTLGAISDPGADTVSSYVVHWGDGSSDTYSSNGAKSHTYADGPNNYNVTVDLVDEDGTFFDRANALSVQVDNVAPSIAISGNASVNEGSSYSLTLGAVSDPGADTVSSYVVHWGDGSSDTYSSNGAKSHTYADGPNDYSITVDLVDEDGTFLDRANPLSVHVNNVAPTASLSGPAQVDEGTTHTYTFTVSDPGDDTFTVNSGYPHCGSGGRYVTGSLALTASGGSFDCSFPDGPATTNVAIRVTDSDGASDTDSESVQVADVANVPPDVTAPADQSSNEGASHSFQLGSFSDPGDDSPWHVTVDWGDGSMETSFDANTTGTIPAQSHTYADGPSDRTVTVTVDDGTDSTSKTFSVHVNNVAPSIAISGNANVDEGSPYSLTLGAVSDPGTDTVSSYVVHWGDGSSDTYSSDGAKSHTYADGPNNDNVTVDLVDEDGTFLDRANAFSVHVNNVPPSVTAAANQSARAGQSKSFNLGSFTDPGTEGTNGWTVDVNWGDLSAHTSFQMSATGTIPGQSHTYASQGTFTVTVTVTDKDGGSDAKSFQVTVIALDAVDDGPVPITANSGNNVIDVLLNDSTTSGTTITTVQSGPGTGGAPNRSVQGVGGSSNNLSICATCSPSGGYAVHYTPPADFTGTDSFTYTISDGTSTDTATVTLNVQTTGSIDSQMFMEDADFHQLDDNSFDVLFSKSPKPYDTSYVRLKNTGPGNLHLDARIYNNTGVNFDADHTNRATVYITVPDMPANCGLGASYNCSAPFQQGTTGDPNSGKPAWVLPDHGRPVDVHPDDRTDDMPVDIKYKPYSAGVDCTNPSGYTSTAPADGVVKCIKITGFAIQRGHFARIHAKFDFRVKDTDWPASANPQLNFRAGFNFKLDKYLTYGYGTSGASTFHALDNVTAVGVGKKVTAIGGFAFLGSVPATGDTVRIFQTAAAAGISPSAPYGSCIVPAYASNLVDGDGFYFIQKQGADQDSTTASNIDSGYKYVVQLCGPSNVPIAARTLKNNLGNKEFDEEDFNDSVNPWPASLTIPHQNNTPSSGDQIRVVFSEPLAEASMCSTWGLDNTRDQMLQPSGTPVTIRVIKNGASPGHDSLIVQGVSGACGSGANNFHFGSIDLGASYITSSAGYIDFTTSRIQWNHNGQLSITLGGTPSGLSPVASPATATYTPDPALTDPAGNPVMGQVSDTPGNNDYHF